MFSLNQTFTFSADAETIVAHIMGAEWRTNNRAVYEVTNGVFAMRAWLSVAPAPKALFVVSIMASITKGVELDYSENAFWILNGADIADIALKQENAGECIAELWVEDDPDRWGRQYTGVWHTGPQLLAMLWNLVVTDWLNRQTAPTGQTGQKKPIPKDDKEEAGPKAGTLDRVREAHRLLKQVDRDGRSRNWAFQKARTDSRTYYRWCEKATGEQPLLLE